MARITAVGLSTDEKREFQKWCLDNDTTMSDVISAIVKRLVANGITFADLMTVLSAIGEGEGET